MNRYWIEIFVDGPLPGWLRMAKVQTLAEALIYQQKWEYNGGEATRLVATT